MEELKSKILYHVQNDQVLEDTEEYYLLKEQIKDKKPVATFESDHTDTGYFENRVYPVTGGLLIISIWQPNPGYCWSEKIVTLVKIP